MFRNKCVLPIVLLVFCALLAATPSMAGPRRAAPPTAAAVIEVPLAHNLDSQQVPADRRLDLAEYSFEFEGATYSLEEINRIKGRLSIEIDNEGLQRKVARVSRVREDEVELLEKAGCSDVTLKNNTASCVFYDVLNCSTAWTRRLTVACGNLIGGITWSVRSFRLGCGFTCIGGNADCSGTLNCYTGAAGTCFNVTSGTVRCAGCFH